MAVRAVTFASHDCDSFVEDVKTKVAAYFESNKLDIKANASMVVKTVIMVGALVGPYAAMLLFPMPGWALVACCVVMGVAMAGVGFRLSHDPVHGADPHNPKVNAAVG